MAESYSSRTDYSAATVADFCTAALTVLSRQNLPSLHAKTYSQKRTIFFAAIT